MKTPSNDLFRLIHSMSSAEKRYFKKDTRESFTADLFDIINEQTEYDEEAVKKRLKDDSFVKNLKVHKNRLQQILLKSLRNFYEEKSLQSKIKVLIENAEILVKKQLFDLSYQQLEKAKQFCENYEEYELLLLVLGIQARLSTYFKELIPATETPLVAMENCAAVIENYVQHALVNKKILHLLETGALSGNLESSFASIYEILEVEIEQKNRQPLSATARRMYYHSLALLYNAKGESQKAYAYTLKILNSFEENNYIKDEKSSQYFNCIVNHLNFCTILNLSAEVDFWVDKAKLQALQFEELRPNLIYVYHFYIKSLQQELSHSKLIKCIVTEVLPMIEEFQLEDEYATKSTLAIAFQSYLALKDDVGAGNLLLRLLNNKQGLATEMFYAISVLDFIYHFSQNDLLLLDNMAVSHQKKMRRNGEFQPFFELTLNFFKKLSNSNLAEQKKLFQLHRTALASHNEDNVYAFLVSVFNYKAWLEAMELRTPFNQVLMLKKELLKDKS